MKKLLTTACFLICITAFGQEFEVKLSLSFVDPELGLYETINEKQIDRLNILKNPWMIDYAETVMIKELEQFNDIILVNKDEGIELNVTMASTQSGYLAYLKIV